jgi:hypothetical protein
MFYFSYFCHSKLVLDTGPDSTHCFSKENLPILYSLKDLLSLSPLSFLTLRRTSLPRLHEKNSKICFCFISFLKSFSLVFSEPVAVETSSVPADFFPEVQTKVPSIETTTRPNNKDDAPAQTRPSLGPVSQSSSFAAVATEGIKTTAIVDDMTAVLPALESRDDIVTTAEEKDDSGHDIKREAVTTAAAEEKGDASDVVAQQAVELEPAALIAEAAAVPDNEKSALKSTTPVIVVSSSARGFEPTSSNVGEATPILPTTTVQKEAFPMPTSLPPDDLGRSWFGKINEKVFLLLCFLWVHSSNLFLLKSLNYKISFFSLWPRLSVR